MTDILRDVSTVSAFMKYATEKYGWETDVIANVHQMAISIATTNDAPSFATAALFINSLLPSSGNFTHNHQSTLNMLLKT